MPNLDITTSSDVDWYKVTAPTHDGRDDDGLDAVEPISARSSPALTVYNASLQVVGGSTGTNYGDTAPCHGLGHPARAGLVHQVIGRHDRAR